MARYNLQHVTSYDYQFPVSVSHHSAHLKPLSDAHQTCEHFSLKVHPSSVDLIERLDFFENTVHMFSIQEGHEALTVESNSIVETTLPARSCEEFDSTLEQVREANRDYSLPKHLETKPFLFHTEITPDLPEVEAFAQRFFQPSKSIGKSLQELLDVFAEEFTFDPEATEVNTPILQVLKQKSGVCQDFAHLMVATLRSANIAARYVSGYILTHPPEGEERLQGADASHAWVSAYDPRNGWLDLDPTNRLVCGDQHIKVAYGRDYSDVTMLGGAVTGGGQQHVKVAVTMQPREV